MVSDGHDVHIYERYRDSAEGMFHVQRFVVNFASRFIGMCTPARMSVYGDPSDELRAGLAGFNLRYLDALAGYVRR
jgi:xanthine dehydrogenase iron-sulfur cluster and FAD-binding subunit A